MAAHLLAEDRELGYRRLIELGIALSAERNHDRLLEKILLGAKELTNADGGTLYLVSEDGRELRFMIMRNDTMNIALGGTTGAPIPFPPVQLRAADGTLELQERRGRGGRAPAKRSISRMPTTRPGSISADRARSTSGPAIARNRS